MPRTEDPGRCRRWQEIDVVGPRSVMSAIAVAALAGSAVGLLAATMSRLYNSTYYALSDTRTPLKFALIRVALTLALGYTGAIVAPPRCSTAALAYCAGGGDAGAGFLSM